MSDNKSQAGKRRSAAAVAPALKASRRPRKGAAELFSSEDERDSQFITTLAKGLNILGAFKSGDGPLGNQELAERTGLPKPTVSRFTHTLTQLGYLAYNSRLSTYELGGRTLILGYAAISNLDVRKVARPIMSDIANATNLNVGLGIRDNLMMLYVEACDGQALVGLRLFPGSRMPVAISAVGRAYLAAISAEERAALMDQLRMQHGADWPIVNRAIERALLDVEARGFCKSIGDWQKDINAVGAPIRLPDGGGVYALNVGGPAYIAQERLLEEEVGPMLAKAAETITARLRGEQNDALLSSSTTG